MRQLGSSLQLKEGADMDGWMEIQWLKVQQVLDHVFLVNLQVLDVGCGIGGPLREIARFR